MMKKYVMDAGNLPNVVGEKIAELRGNSRELDTKILASWGTDFKTLRDTGLLSN